MTVPPGGPAPDGSAGDGRLQVVVAPLRSRDLKAVLRIEDEVFDEPWSKRLFEEELAQRTSRAYRGAWVGDALVGYAGQMSVDDEAHVNNIAVAPTWVGRRLGTVLMADLVRTALARGSAHLTLEVAVGNDTAQALYRRFGMAPVGVRPNYYARGGDALIMWVRDIDTGAYAERLAGI
ncbi:MAG TPA: ribosomal protein S18-alanine N-acetyltransferase, partial [Acidimicrobiales bacterium]